MPFEGYKSATHHLIEDRKEAVEFFLRVHDFNNYGQIHRKLNDLGAVDSTARAETYRFTEHRRSPDMHFASFQNNGLIKTPVVIYRTHR